MDFPALDLEIDSEIPMQAGLGSSAAATVAGLRMYDAMAGGTARDLIQEGTAFEGHPDNIAAALLGGLATGCVCDDGRVLAGSVPWPARVRFVVATPEVAREDAGCAARAARRRSRARTRSSICSAWRCCCRRCSSTVRSCCARRSATGGISPIARRLVPGLAEALALDHPDLLGVCLSGSGPTVVALVAGETGGIEQALAAIYARLDVPCQLRVLNAHNGVRDDL